MTEKPVKTGGITDIIPDYPLFFGVTNDILGTQKR